VSARAFGRLLAAPAVALLLAVGVGPLLYALWTSLHQVSLDPSVPSSFRGAGNFLDLFADPRFRKSILVTLVVMVSAVALQLSLGFLLALALHQVRRGRGVVLSLLLVPTAIAPLIAGIAWWMLFNTNYGAVNALLGAKVEWTRTMPWALVAIVVAVVWQWTPFVAVILLGGLSTIPPSVLEAARIDGAGTWATLRRITLPYLRPFLLVAGLLMIIEVARLYEVPFYLTEGGPGDETWLAGICLFKLAFTYSNFGGASAMALLLVAALTVVATAYVRLVSPRRGA
jgi:multiple sugar transport system permease protein